MAGRRAIIGGILAEREAQGMQAVEGDLRSLLSMMIPGWEGNHGCIPAGRQSSRSL